MQLRGGDKLRGSCFDIIAKAPKRESNERSAVQWGAHILLCHIRPVRESCVRRSYWPPRKSGTTLTLQADVIAAQLRASEAQERACCCGGFWARVARWRRLSLRGLRTAQWNQRLQIARNAASARAIAASEALRCSRGWDRDGAAKEAVSFDTPATRQLLQSVVPITIKQGETTVVSTPSALDPATSPSGSPEAGPPAALETGAAPSPPPSSPAPSPSSSPPSLATSQPMLDQGSPAASPQLPSPSTSLPEVMPSPQPPPSLTLDGSGALLPATSPSPSAAVPAPSPPASTAVTAPADSTVSGAPPAALLAASPDEVPLAATRACDWRLGDDECEYWTSCVPLPNRVTAGACMLNPVGGVSLPLGLGRPLFYWPLTNGSLASWPWRSRRASMVMGQGSWEAVEEDNNSTATAAATDPSDAIPGAFRCGGG
ncbi:hypothetical protein QJQ45_020783, partial [Haematococcus lacustris]